MPNPSREESMHNYLENRFVSLCGRLGSTGDARKLWKAMAMEYNAPGRFYHTTRHIKHCIEELDDYRDLVDGETADYIEYALFFHDLKYNTKSKTNEKDSADFAKSWIYILGLSLGAPYTEKLIMATTHSSVSEEFNEKLICDIDLAVLGSYYRTYDMYEENIRKEYEWVPEDSYRAGRIKILQSFLDRDPLYLTEKIRERYEKIAKSNLKRAINNLEVAGRSL